VIGVIWISDAPHGSPPKPTPRPRSVQIAAKSTLHGAAVMSLRPNDLNIRGVVGPKWAMHRDLDVFDKDWRTTCPSLREFPHPSTSLGSIISIRAFRAPELGPRPNN
jgi:hypothetical protein